MLTKSVDFDIPTLRHALLATAEHRKTKDVITQESTQRIKEIAQSTDVRHQWENYCATFNYAKGISFETVVSAVRDLLGKTAM